MSYQYPQRFVKFDPSHMKYLMPRKMSNDPDDLSYNVKIVSGGRSKKVLCLKRIVKHSQMISDGLKMRFTLNFR